MVPGVGKPKTESAWALGRGPKEDRKKQKITLKLKLFLNMINLLLGIRKRFLIKR